MASFFFWQPTTLYVPAALNLVLEFDFLSEDFSPKKKKFNKSVIKLILTFISVSLCEQNEAIVCGETKVIGTEQDIRINVE